MSRRDRSNAVFLHRSDWERLEKAAKQSRDLAQRRLADYVNLQERVKREREEWSKYMVSGFVAEFLPALDSLAESERALREAAEPGAVLDGLKILQNEFLRILAKRGVTPIEAVGRPFDPNVHEAVGVVETGEAEPDTVVEEVRRGWMIHERVLRAAMVRVAKKP